MTEQPARHTADTITDAALDELYATVRRLNRRAQAVESENAAFRRAVAQWDVSDRGTFIPHASLVAIGRAAGTDVLGSVRHLKHFARVEQAEAAIAEARNWARHGYEIGQRHCGWTDHGVAPAWLTEGWPTSSPNPGETPSRAEPDSVLHAERRHPGWEYATTEGPRKSWQYPDEPPCDDNGDPDPTWERNVDAGRPGEGWDRFDYTEESYWRRRKTETPDA